VRVNLRRRHILVSKHSSHEARVAAAEKKTEEWIAKLNRGGIVDANWYLRATPHISEWRKANRHQQRKDANTKRWLKENRKKLLRVLLARVTALSQAEKCSLARPKTKKVTGSHRKK
jgi:hypothetical protein